MAILLNSIKRTQRLIKRWSSLNQSEVDKFAAMSSDWWDQVKTGLQTPYGPLIHFNPILVGSKCAFALVE